MALTLGGVALLVLLTDWNRQFYDALERRDGDAFSGLLLRFGVLPRSSSWGRCIGCT